ncbi:MAG: signal peptidase I [Candidatus Bathyarchaeia archaeon]
MDAETFRRIWGNEYVKTVITLALMFLLLLCLLFGAQLALGTEYPALAVASGSMLPTLNIGDLIIVQKVEPFEINADPKGLTGDILVYKRGNELIVHRAVKIELRDSVYYITTRGDNSGADDPAWPSSLLVGKVIARVPYLGNLPLFLHSERNTYMIFLIFIAILLIVLMLPSSSHNGGKSSLEGEFIINRSRTFPKINSNLFAYIILNIVIFGLIIFSLWGSFTFWQPGATPTYSTIRGMYADIEFHKNFPRVSEAILYQSLLLYKIDCDVDGGGTRLGVPAFSWYQLFILIFIAFNALKILRHVKRWKAVNADKAKV